MTDTHATNSTMTDVTQLQPQVPVASTDSTLPEALKDLDTPAANLKEHFETCFDNFSMAYKLEGIDDEAVSQIRSDVMSLLDQHVETSDGSKGEDAMSLDKRSNAPGDGDLTVFDKILPKVFSLAPYGQQAFSVWRFLETLRDLAIGHRPDSLSSVDPDRSCTAKWFHSILKTASETPLGPQEGPQEVLKGLTEACTDPAYYSRPCELFIPTIITLLQHEGEVRKPYGDPNGDARRGLEEYMLQVESKSKERAPKKESCSSGLRTSNRLQTVALDLIPHSRSRAGWEMVRNQIVYGHMMPWSLGAGGRARKTIEVGSKVFHLEDSISHGAWRMLDMLMEGTFEMALDDPREEFVSIHCVNLNIARRHMRPRETRSAASAPAFEESSA